jgi:hypothetical protein
MQSIGSGHRGEGWGTRHLKELNTEGTEKNLEGTEATGPDFEFES